MARAQRRPLVLVSIHAPAQGATPRPIRRWSRIPSFDPRPRAGGNTAPAAISAAVMAFRSTPPRRGQRPASDSASRGACFDPRPRAGGNRRRNPHRRALRGVSIHAPAQGATPARRTGGVRRRSFDPRPRAGGNTAPAAISAAVTAFRSTPPRRGQRAASAGKIAAKAFRSTPPRRGQPQFDVRRKTQCQVSIHAPAQGATRAGGCARPGQNSFDPRPRAGGNLAPIDDHPPRRGVSIHAPAQGATRRRATSWRGASSFDPRPRAGGNRRRFPRLW